MLSSKLIVFSLSFLILSACVKPRNHDSAIDTAATFFVDEVKTSLDTAETVPGFTIPASRLFTFTACIRDRRTSETLPGAPFVISGGERDQEIHTDKTGCAVWSEKVAFNYLANESYVEVDRVITAKGSQEGARTVRLAINPWKLNSKSQLMYDLEYHKDLPEKQLVKAFAAAAERPLALSSLPIKNTSVQTNDGTIARNFRVLINPLVVLTDIEGAPVNVPFQVSADRLEVSAQLIESVTSGGLETKSVVAQTSKASLVKVDGGQASADLKLQVSRGTQSSRYFLALKVTPVNGPKGLTPFEGLFTLGDLRSVTEEGTTTADLKASNLDNTFSYSEVAGALAVSKLQALETDVKPERITNRGNGRNVKTFSISQLQPRYTVRDPNETALKRTIIYQVQACVTDLSNGGRTADGEEFSIQRADKTWIKQSASSLDGLHGCLVWEDRITHNYYEPEHWTIVNVTIKHKSGYSETRQYAIDPWQSFRFNADPSLTPQAIREINGAAANLKSYLIADAIEFNTAGHLDYGVDDFMNLRTIKTVSIKVPLRVARPSNAIDGLSASPEPLRAGSWLIRAAYVSPIMNTAAPLNGSGLRSTSHLAVAPLLGGQQVVQVKGGSLYADLPFQIQDLRLMNTRAYLVFEVVPYDEKSKKIDLSAGLGVQTFAAPLNFKSEKDASGVVRGTADLGALIPTRDTINSIASQNQASPAVRQAVAGLAGQTVSKLYAQAAVEAEAYRRSMAPQRSLGAVARRANAEFAFIQNEQFNAKNDKVLQANNRFLPAPSKAIDALLKTLNTPLSSMGAASADQGYTVTRDELLKAVKGVHGNGTSMSWGVDERLAAKLCGYFFYTKPRTKIQGLAWNRVEYGTSGNWVNLCLSQIKSGGVTSAFAIENRLNVLATNGVSVKKGGTRSDQQFKTGSQIGYAQYQTTTNGWASGFGAGGLLSELAGGLKSAGGAFRIFSAVLGGLGIEMSHSVSDSSTVQMGFGFEFGHGFMVEQTELNVNVTKSDACLIVRPKPEMFKSMRMGLHLKLFVREFGGDQKAAEAFMARGLMICNGLASMKPRIVSERYYSVVSANQGGGQNDLGDSRGIPWLMQLRGQRDFAAFLQLSTAEKQTVAQAGQPMDIGDLPNVHLQEAYDTYFAGKMSTMPGFITLEPKYVFTPNK